MRQVYSVSRGSRNKDKIKKRLQLQTSTILDQTKVQAVKFFYNPLCRLSLSELIWDDETYGAIESCDYKYLYPDALFRTV